MQFEGTVTAVCSKTFMNIFLNGCTLVRVICQQSTFLEGYKQQILFPMPLAEIYNETSMSCFCDCKISKNCPLVIPFQAIRYMFLS